MKKFENLDSCPYSGKVDCSNNPIKVMLADLEQNYWLKRFFDKTPNVEQVENVTPNKIYDVIEYEVMGDVADVTFIDDLGEKQKLMECFFEEA